MTERGMIAYGSGNVFEDLGAADPRVQLVKADLVSKIASVIETRGLAQVEAARLVGVSRAKVSRLVRGNFREFELDGLCRILNRLGVTVSIVLTEEPGWGVDRPRSSPRSRPRRCALTVRN